MIRHFILGLFFSVSIFYADFLINLIANQYYSLKRVIKSILNYFFIHKKITFSLLIVFLFSLLLIHINYDEACLLFNVIIQLILITLLPYSKIKRTRRNISLEVVEILELCSLVFFIPFRIITILCSFYFCFYLLILSFSYLFNSPLEGIIKKRFLNSAKRKIIGMKNTIFIGVTGSFGKTTMKNYLFALLKSKYQVRKSNGNINTFIGNIKFVNEELSIFDEIVIFELGIDEVKGMKRFKKFISLDYAVITSIGKMHLATFKSFNNIIKGKCRIEELLKPDGKIYLPKELEYVKKNLKREPVFYQNFLQIRKTSVLGSEVNLLGENLFLNIYGQYGIEALNGAISIALDLGVSKEEILSIIPSISPPERRMKVYKNNNQYLIDNSYNANYLGILSSISLIKNEKGKKMIITGGLVELGKEFGKENEKMGVACQELDYIVLISEQVKHPLEKGLKDKKRLFKVRNIEEAKNMIQELNPDFVLLTAKGSDIFVR